MTPALPDDREMTFVDAFVRAGGDTASAAREAGLSQADACRMLMEPRVQKAIALRRQVEITTGGATRALEVMKEVMERAELDTDRFKAAKWLLEAAGHGTEGAKAAAKLAPKGRKSTDDMTKEELEAYLAELRRNKSDIIDA